MRTCVFCCLFCYIWCCNYPLKAQGFPTNSQGVRQMAMAGSGTALTWNSDVLFYNPAGLSDLNLWEVSASGGAGYRDISFTNNTGSAKPDIQVVPVYNLYAAGPIRAAQNKVSVGIGIYTPFANTISWPNNWAGKYLVQSQSFRTIFAQPTVCYKFSNRISVGAGYVIAYGTMKRQQATVVPDASGNNDGYETLAAPLWGRGFNAGFHWKITKRLQLGLSYRSQVNMLANGGKTEHFIGAAYRDSFPQSKIRTTIPLPQTASIGLGFRVTNKLVLQADVNFNGWDCYDSVKIDIAQNTSLQDDKTEVYKYRNTFTYRLGINYAFTEKFALMLGGAWDESPVNPAYELPTMPDSDKIIGSLGAYFRPFEKVSISFAGQYYFYEEKGTRYYPGNFSGSYSMTRISAMAGVALDF